jgi:hypothetical protein
MVISRVDNGAASGSSAGRKQPVALMPAPRDPMLTRDRALDLVQGLLVDGIISPTDLRAYVPAAVDPYDPEVLRQDYESWFQACGIEVATQRKFKLAPCPFVREELAEAAEQGWIPVVSPKDLTLPEVATTFQCPTWATTDPLVSAPPEEEDLWFLTPASLVPDDANSSARELRKKYEEHDLLGLSLQRYIIISARLRYLTGQQPDHRWWVWIFRGRYDRSGFMIAGFDPNNRFSVHAWLPQFQASFVGSRPIRICQRIALAGQYERASSGTPRA